MIVLGEKTTTVRDDLKHRGRGGAIFAGVSESPLAEMGHSFSDESLSLCDPASLLSSHALKLVPFLPCSHIYISFSDTFS